MQWLYKGIKDRPVTIKNEAIGKQEVRVSNVKMVVMGPKWAEDVKGGVGG